MKETMPIQEFRTTDSIDEYDGQIFDAYKYNLSTQNNLQLAVLWMSAAPEHSCDERSFKASSSLWIKPIRLRAWYATDIFYQKTQSILYYLITNSFYSLHSI